jgi:hypothetical protein
MQRTLGDELKVVDSVLVDPKAPLLVLSDGEMSALIDSIVGGGTQGQLGGSRAVVRRSSAPIEHWAVSRALIVTRATGQ